MTTHRHDIGRMRACLLRHAPDEARRIAHSLRGAAATLGVLAMAEGAQQIETLLQEDPTRPADDLSGPMQALDLQLQRLQRVLGEPLTAT